MLGSMLRTGMAFLLMRLVLSESSPSLRNEHRSPVFTDATRVPTLLQGEWSIPPRGCRFARIRR